MGARIDHADEEIKGAVRVAHNEEQGGFLIAQGIQLQLVISCNFPQLRTIKGGQPCAAAHKDRLRGFAWYDLSRTF